MEGGHAIPTQSSRDGCVHGRFHQGVGSGVPRSLVEGLMETQRSSHQLVGVTNSTDCDTTPPTSNEGQIGTDSDRQHNSSGLSEESRRYQVKVSHETGGENFDASIPERHNSQATTHNRTVKRLDSSGFKEAVHGVLAK